MGVTFPYRVNDSVKSLVYRLAGDSPFFTDLGRVLATGKTTEKFFIFAIKLFGNSIEENFLVYTFSWIIKRFAE